MGLVCAGRLGRYVTRAIGTRADILTADPGAIDMSAGLLEAWLDRVDRVASRFRADSELSALNAAGGAPFPASPDLVEVLAVALRAARLTSGLVTPTVGRAMAQIGYDRDFAAMDPDQAGAVPASAPVPAWELIELDPTSRTVRLAPGVAVDLGATAKAWAADRIAREASVLAGCGVLVSLGGDVSVSGSAPADGWSVGVADRCEADAASADVVVCLRDGALATSGTSARQWRRAGRVVHHLIDPATGLPAESCWRTVSVAAASCVDANVAATASIIKGRGAPEWLAELGLPARLVGVSGEAIVTGGWPAGPGG